MLLKSHNNIFYLEASYDERHIAKAAGFRWHGTPGSCLGNCAACISNLGKFWWTDVGVNALQLIQYADSGTKLILNNIQETINKSHSSASTNAIDIRTNNDLVYYEYQKAGIEFALDRKRCLIGDAMGLGKTCQAIGVINYLYNTIDRVLVVAPPSLRSNWGKELHMWLTDAWSVHVIHNVVDIYAHRYNIIRDGCKRIFIVSANQVASSKDVHAKNILMSIRWDINIVDEAHLYKNQKTQRSKTVTGVYKKDALVQPGLSHVADRVLYLTGTAIANKPIELFPILRVLDPGGLGSSFMRYAVRYCNGHRGRFGWDFNGASNLDELRDRLRSTMMIRRLKEDVLKDLPPKRRQIIELDSVGVRRMLDSEIETYSKYENNIHDLQTALDEAERAEDFEEFKRLGMLLKEMHGTAFRDMAAARKRIAEAKIPLAIEHIECALDSSANSIIVFAHHHNVINAIKERFDTPLVITGKTPAIKRQDIVDSFQKKEHRLFIGNLIAAGTGITLTAADTVIFTEMSWVPSDMLQAEDRAHRISQANSVLVQYLVFNNSLDSKMLKTLIKKMEIIEQALDKSKANSPDRAYMLGL